MYPTRNGSRKSSGWRFSWTRASRSRGTGKRIGLEALLGLIPGLGDLATAVVSLHIISEARKLGAPKTIVSKMIWNVLIDTAVGAVPGVGDVFDAFWKANRKNIDLIKRHYDT